MKIKKILGFFGINLLISVILGFFINFLVYNDFSLDFHLMDEFKNFADVQYLKQLAGFIAICFVLITIVYITFIDKSLFDLRTMLSGKGKQGQIESNLENSRWMTDKERNDNFPYSTFEDLPKLKKDGVPLRAEMIKKGRHYSMNVNFISPCHSLIIGSTGSGKTTTFINPMIQLLANTDAKSSMIITDPKGELFSLHSKFLRDRGYDCKVLDLRDTYSSYRWNPLEIIYDKYHEYLNAENEVYARTDDVKESGLEIRGTEENFINLDEWYEFNNRAYSNKEQLIVDVKVFKKQTFDEVYEDLNDLVCVLIPITNNNDPMWEKGARGLVHATLLAMLEDSENPELGMTRDKYNFFNLSKILQNSSNEYMELRRYFGGRDVLSKAYALSKQTMDCADTTRASYMSIVYEKLQMFNDAGICAMTSASDIDANQIADQPTALFLKIPDEKDTRHNLAAVFILNIYKALIKKASSYADLSLKRNVYYIMDEFGNMPKIEKFDKMITVGRSRKIWFNMVVQSYSQFNNVYGDLVAEIIKGNCGVKMFIGSNDMNTCKEYSELCGNMTVVTTSTSSSGKSTDVNYSSQLQTRPLIYPSELQKLNNKYNQGNSIVVTFGNHPLRTKFTPSYKVPLYKTGMMDLGEIKNNIFDEDSIFYDLLVRNKVVLEGADAETARAYVSDSFGGEEEVVSEDALVQAAAIGESESEEYSDIFEESGEQDAASGEDAADDSGAAEDVDSGVEEETESSEEGERDEDTASDGIKTTDDDAGLDDYKAKLAKYDAELALSGDEEKKPVKRKSKRTK